MSVISLLGKKAETELEDEHILDFGDNTCSKGFLSTFVYGEERMTGDFST